jgi:predicted Zn-dependent protease/peptidoglycan/xylan/chitin deacetylase (PgdA/CDA1 family)
MKTELLAATLAVLLPVLAAAAPLEEGLQLMSEKRYPEAVVKLELAQHSDPGSSNVLLNLGWAYWHDRRIDDAWRVGSTLVKLDPQNKTFQMFLANTEIEKKDYAGAVERMNRALKLAPEDRDVTMVLARALFLSGRENEAMDLTDKVLARSPDDTGVEYRKATFLSDMGRKKEALAALDKLLAADPENPAFRRGRAKILSELGREAEAKAEWEEITRKRQDAGSLMNLGWAYWKEKDYDAAWQVATLLVKLDDKNASFLRFMANMEIERMNYAEALRVAQKALSLAPGDRDVELTLSKAYFRMQREKEAMDILQKLIARYPDDPAVRYRWAEFLGRTGRHDESLYSFDRLIKEFPTNDAYRMNRAQVYYDMGRFDAAVAEWETAASEKTPNAAALRLVRDDAFNKRDWERAAEWQKKIIAESPRDPSGWEKLSRIYDLMKDEPKALDAAEQGIAVDPIAINNYYLAAQALAVMENWPAAKKAYEDIIDRNPNSIRAFDGLSYVLEAQGDYRAALKAVRRIEVLTAPTVSPFLEIHRARLLADWGKFSQAHALLRKLAADRRAVIPVLLYHGISRFDRSDAMPAATLRRQLLLLKDKGYHSVTVTDLDKILRGEAPLPEKPLVITFDDGRTDSFENADPILKETGFRATMFVHVSKLRKPHFHASPEEIARWQANGRWDMQAHGYEAHDPMPLDAYGRKGHFLPNRKWLNDLNRLETLPEYRARVAGDYEKARKGVEEIVPNHSVIAFAYPYGDYGQNDYSNTPESAAINHGLVRKNFHLAFVQEQYGMNTVDSNPTDLRRFEVPKYMTAEQLSAHLVLNVPNIQARMLEAELWIRADQVGRAEGIYAQLRDEAVDEPRVWADEGVAFQKAGDISYAQNLFSQAERLEPDQEGPAGELDRKLVAQAEHAASPIGSLELQAFSDSNTNSIEKAFVRGAGVVKTVRLSGWVAEDRYADNLVPGGNTPAILAQEGGVEARWFATRSLDLDAFYARRQFTQGFIGSADNYSVAGGYQVLPQLKLALRDGMGDVETSSAIRANRKFHSDGAGAVWDPALNWKGNADYDRTWYNDANAEDELRLRVTKRFSERVAVGAAYYHGDSRFDAEPAYYTPRGLNQYTGVLTLNQMFGEVNPRTGLSLAEAMIQYEGGYGFQPSGSRGVQSVHALVTCRPADRVSLSLDGQYSQSPTYSSRRVDASASFTF